jgi:hypothetical protein
MSVDFHVRPQSSWIDNLTNWHILLLASGCQLSHQLGQRDS